MLKWARNVLLVCFFPVIKYILLIGVAMVRTFGKSPRVLLGSRLGAGTGRTAARVPALRRGAAARAMLWAARRSNNNHKYGSFCFWIAHIFKLKNTKEAHQARG